MTYILISKRSNFSWFSASSICPTEDINSAFFFKEYSSSVSSVTTAAWQVSGMCHTSLHAQCFLAVLQLPPAWLAALLLSLLLSPKWRKTGCEALVGAHPWLPLLSTLVCLPWGECFCLPGKASCPAAQVQVPSQAAPSGHTEGTLCSRGCELQAWSLQISCHPLPDCFLVPSGCGLPPSDPFQLTC